MKKIIISSVLVSSLGFAAGLDLTSCVKTDVDSKTVIFSCQSGDYLVRYDRDNKKELADKNPITKLADKCLRVEDVLKYIKNR